MKENANQTPAEEHQGKVTKKIADMVASGDEQGAIIMASILMGAK